MPFQKNFWASTSHQCDDPESQAPIAEPVSVCSRAESWEGSLQGRCPTSPSLTPQPCPHCPAWQHHWPPQFVILTTATKGWKCQPQRNPAQSAAGPLLIYSLLFICFFHKHQLCQEWHVRHPRLLQNLRSNSWYNCGWGKGQYRCVGPWWVKRGGWRMLSPIFPLVVDEGFLSCPAMGWKLHL